VMVLSTVSTSLVPPLSAILWQDPRLAQQSRFPIAISLRSSIGGAGRLDHNVG
jgi:hypothetical protein